MNYRFGLRTSFTRQALRYDRVELLFAGVPIKTGLVCLVDAFTERLEGKEISCRRSLFTMTDRPAIAPGPKLAGRLTAELISRSPQYMSCVKTYEIDLRGERANKRSRAGSVALRLLKLMLQQQCA